MNIPPKYEDVVAQLEAALGRETTLREELGNHDSASHLMNAWVAEKGQMHWVTAINIMAIATKMSDEERQLLLDMDDGSAERGALVAERDALQQRLTVAEQRASLLQGLLEGSFESVMFDLEKVESREAETYLIALIASIKAALKPAEEGEGS